MLDVKGTLAASRVNGITMENTAKNSGIWAVGGGKGGTGKSFLTSSMATCLALKGKPTILLDADLGGANLHNFLGMIRPKRSLTDFIMRLDEAFEKLTSLYKKNQTVVTLPVKNMDDDLRLWIAQIECFTGAALRAVRERMQIDLKAVFAVTRIQTQFLEDVEREDFKSFPAEIYLRSYLIAYARFLSLDTQRVLSDYLPRYRAARDNSAQ